MEFRPRGASNWHRGRVENLTSSEVLFACHEPLDIGSEVEIRVFEKESGNRAKRIQVGKIVRRVLMTWPDVGLLMEASFLTASADGSSE